MFIIEMFGDQTNTWAAIGAAKYKGFKTADHVLKDYERLYPYDKFRIVYYTKEEEE